MRNDPEQLEREARELMEQAMKAGSEHDKDDGLDHDHTQAASFGCGRSAVKRVGLVI